MLTLLTLIIYLSDFGLHLMAEHDPDSGVGTYAIMAYLVLVLWGMLCVVSWYHVGSAFNKLTYTVFVLLAVCEIFFLASAPFYVALLVASLASLWLSRMVAR